MSFSIPSHVAALSCALVLSSCVTPARLGPDTKIGCQVIDAPGPSAMSGSSGQGALLDAVVAAAVDAAIDSDDRRRKDAVLVEAIRSSIEDELSRQSSFRYVRQVQLKGTGNSAPLKKLNQEAAGFIATNGLTYAARIKAQRMRGTKGLSDVPKLKLTGELLDATGKSLGYVFAEVEGNVPEGSSWWKGVNPRDPKLIAQWRELASQAARQLIPKWQGR